MEKNYYEYLEKLLLSKKKLAVIFYAKKLRLFLWHSTV
jgi:hypothetical protein